MKCAEAVASLDGVSHVIRGYVGEHIFKMIARRRSFYEPDLLLAIREMMLHGTYVDVGANIGNHSVWFSKACSSTRVISIEPNDHNLNLLRHNVCDLLNVEIVPEAIGFAGTTTDLGVCWVNSTDGPESHRHVVCEAPSRLLDEVLADINDVVLLKIDIDGHDVKVLRAAPQVIERCRPVIAIEVFMEGAMEELQLFCKEHRYELGKKYCATPTYIVRPL